TWRRACGRALLCLVSLKVYSWARRSVPLRSALGLTKVRREQPLASTATARASRHDSRRRSAAPRFQPLPEVGLAPGAVRHLALELAAGGIDVVAAGAAHRRDPAGLVEELLEAADRRIVRTLEARAGERVERDQVDLGRVLHLQPVVEVAHQPDQLARMP